MHLLLHTCWDAQVASPCTGCPLVLPTSGVNGTKSSGWRGDTPGWVLDHLHLKSQCGARASLPPLLAGAWLCGGRVNCFSLIFPGFTDMLLSHCLHILTLFSWAFPAEKIQYMNPPLCLHVVRCLIKNYKIYIWQVSWGAVVTSCLNWINFSLYNMGFVVFILCLSMVTFL